MEVVQERITVPADRSKLAELRAFLHRLCRQVDVRPDTTRRLVLAIDEATSNIMEHSRVAPDAPIDISLEFGDDNIIVQIRDGGIDFDPSKSKRTLHNGVEGHKRGFGLYLIHLITDEVQYQRTDDGTNVLTLTIDSR